MLGWRCGDRGDRPRSWRCGDRPWSWLFLSVDLFSGLDRCLRSRPLGLRGGFSHWPICSRLSCLLWGPRFGLVGGVPVAALRGWITCVFSVCLFVFALYDCFRVFTASMLYIQSPGPFLVRNLPPMVWTRECLFPQLSFKPQGECLCFMSPPIRLLTLGVISLNPIIPISYLRPIFYIWPVLLTLLLIDSIRFA